MTPDTKRTVDVLNRLLEAELAGVIRYTHYSLLVFGYGRIPIVSWMREQANESLVHAQQLGEWITTLGAYPSLGIGPLLDSHETDIGVMLRESLEVEANALVLYRELLAVVEGKSIALEEFARQMINQEELHAAEVDKMLRKPGELAVAKPELRLDLPRTEGRQRLSADGDARNDELFDLSLATAFFQSRQSGHFDANAD